MMHEEIWTGQNSTSNLRSVLRESIAIGLGCEVRSVNDFLARCLVR